ncbi:MAG TPA: xanthine dehydrogenase family protein subunit M [Candidatus Cloacimonadota bacterium]|nr:xanthine dehydrogenase family protein subunit M [Candidatus Cloacimonadota bacterium]HQL14607.1 xanthine dehydrogenase family protein subunit M [Candidatus Cloacimonadota bacterium]
MAITHEFKYFRPTNLAEIIELLHKYGDKAKLLAGGTDLTVNIKENIEQPEAVIDIKAVPELSILDNGKDGLFIGANVTFTDLLEAKAIQKDYLLLWEAARSVASVGIRNRATLIGNICSAVPSLDSAPALLCYDAVVHLQNYKGKREVPISEWFLGPRKTARKADELVLGVSLLKPRGKHTGCYLKLGRYNGEDLAQAGLALLASASDDYKAAWCAVGPVPKRSSKIEDLLHGKSITPELIRKAKALVADEISPITDLRASREYRLHLCEIMLERGLQVCQMRLQGKKIDTRNILGG